MLEKVEVISQMFHGFAYEDYFEADTGKKLSLILAAEEHIEKYRSIQDRNYVSDFDKEIKRIAVEKN